MSLRSQQRKAMVLSVLMVMLAQSAYSQYYQGWFPSELEEISGEKTVSHSTCLAATRTSGDPINVDVVDGNNSYPGTNDCPKKSLENAISVAVNSDEIILHSGLYHENVSIDGIDNLLIRAAAGEKVVFDGTKSISQDLGNTWSTADSDGIQEVTLSVDGWQLFLDYDEQVPARWPNAQFSDGTVFNRSYWAEGTLTGTNNAYTKGWLTDAGPESGVHTGLNETINATGLDPVGAIAVMNLGSFRSNSRVITDWYSANGTFAYDGTGVSWKNKHHAYFLEGKRELIDVDGEWWYNNTNNRLHYKTPTGQDANNLDLRVKVQPFAVSVDNSDGVTIQGIDFFGTTVNFNNCDGCSFTNATLEYPSTSKRGLGIAGESEDDRWMTRFYRCENTFVDRISVTNTDGGALEFHGSGGQSHNNTVNNSYFHAIDWSAADQKGLMTTIYEGGRDMYFTNNSVNLTGASSVLSIGDAPKVFYNEVWNVGHLQTDGAVVQVMQGEAPGAEIAYNWIHDVIKYGARFDAPIDEVGEGRNGTMHHNVIWNAAGGLMVKGDYHNIHNNTVFNSTGKNDIIFLTDDGINNKNSTIHHNAVDALADHRSKDIFDYPLPDGVDWMNWNGYMQKHANSLSIYNTHSCAILENNSLVCWGNNGQGRLGIGNTISQSTPQYVDFGAGRTVRSLSIGGALSEHTCAILDNGSLNCWGNNGNGKLGIGNTTNQYSPRYVDIGTGRTALKITTGYAHTCALLDNKSVSCWGSNTFGQLGINSTVTNSLTPVHVDLGNGRTAVELQSGHLHTCAILDNGSVSCWGYNHYGQMGFGNSSNKVDPPTIIPTDSNRQVTSLAIGKHHTCLTYDNGSMFCSGRSNNGQLGQGNTATSLVFKHIPYLLNYTVQASTGSYQSCGLNTNGSIQCWGSNTGGQLGDGSTTTRTSPVNTSLPNGRKAVFLTMGHSHTCAILDNGSTACWGHNGVGQLGLGNTSGQTKPVITLLGDLKATTVRDMLVDPDNRDFRPQWGSHLHALNAGAYDVDDSNPWTAGVSWTYTPMDNPISGCMNSLAQNYNSAAVLSDGSCILTTLSSSSSHISLEVGLTMTPHQLTYTTPYLVDAKQTAASVGVVGVGVNIALDSNGAAHICSKISSTGDLYYTTNASGVWESDTIDSSGNIGGDCFIILDSDDDIHITYRDDTNKHLKYATKALASGIDSNNWTISTADNNGNVGNFGSMAVDSEDRLHVAYYSSSGTLLKYGTKEDGSTTWNREIVDSPSDVGKYTSIDLDSNGKPHITYQSVSNNRLKYAHKMGSSWYNTTIDTTSNTAKGTSLAIDSNGHLHVAYKTNSTEVAYITNKSGSWIKTTLDANSTGTWGVNYIDIMLDEGDNPHVVYSNEVNKDIFYMSNVRGDWERILVAGDSVSRTSSAAMDEHGGIHVAYYIDGSFDDLGYASVRSLTHRPLFEIEPGLPTGLSLGDENGTIYGTPSVYQNSKQYTVWANTTYTSAKTTFTMNVDWGLISSVKHLKTPRNTPITPITFNWTAWSSNLENSNTTVNSSGSVGNYNSLVIDSSNKAHIVHWHEGDADLLYTTNSSGTWKTSIVESSGNIGKYCSLAIDSNDGLHVSYQSNTGNSLKYAYKAASSTTWSDQTVDNTGGKYTAIVLDSNDKPHIAYRDYGGDLGYAEKTGSTWTNTTIQSAGEIHATSIAIDSDDHIHVAYFDSSNKDMFYITNSSGTWSSKTKLERIGTSTGGSGLSIAISPITDQPGISYFVTGATDLKYTYYDGSTWTNQTISPAGDYGRFNSLAYDSAGNAHISHERNGPDDMYYTTDATGVWNTTAIDTTNSVGLYTDIAVDSNDDVHIAYRSNTWQDLKYATVQGYKTGTFARSDVSGATCSITPGLPNGLTLSPGTCTISGTPTNDDFNKTYNLTATSSTGVAKTGEFKIWVTMIAPTISYSGSPYTFNKDVAISAITPSSSGDSAMWSASPSLPSGLNINPSTGVISGTPTVTSELKSYNISAWNNGGNDIFEIYITINSQPPSNIIYSPHDMVLTKGSTMSTNTPSASGGAVTSWEISPSISALGLSFSSSTGAISGTPNTLQTSAATYTVWANNSGGSTSTTVNITIKDIPPNSIVYASHDLILEKGTPVTTTTPVTSGGAVSTWEISPSIATLGLTFSSSTGAISGTPNTLQTTPVTYTVWANNSGGSASTTVNITINDVLPNSLGYSPPDMILTKGTAMTTNIPSVSGGSVTSWEISPTFTNGLSFNSSNGAISGTPNILQTTAVMYTIWANNSGGSTSANVNITINDAAPFVCYGECTGPHLLKFAQNVTINTVLPKYAQHIGHGIPTSCSTSPSLPSGLSISPTCVITGTPTVLSSYSFYDVIATNSGGSNTNPNALYIGVFAEGGLLTITPVNSEGSVNNTHSNVTMTYSHVASNYGWTSGVTNSTDMVANYIRRGHDDHLLEIAYGEQDEVAIVFARNDTSDANTKHSLALAYKWNGAWTETILDNATDTGQHPSVAIDRNGAIHIAYIDYSSNPDVLRYATNASGTWSYTTLGNSTYDNDGGRGTSIVIHPITNAVHIVSTINDNTYRDLIHYTNETGSWINTTITNTSRDEGHDPSMAMDGYGNLYVAYYCDDGCSDLMLARRINGVWKNETVAGSIESSGSKYNVGNNPDIAIDSQGKIHIVSIKLNQNHVYLHSGVPGNWSETIWETSNSFWPTIDVDSNDDVHIAYRKQGNDDLIYITNASGSWSSPKVVEGGNGGWGSDMVIDNNDDVLIAHITRDGVNKLQVTTVKGTGEGITPRPIFNISPELPDGLHMNWQNGTIWGTPTEDHANITHTVTVNALGHTTTATFTLFVSGVPGSISYADISGSVGIPISPVTPVFSNTSTSGSPTSWAINATPPSGLTFETSNGTIWGTPTLVEPGAVFTIWANNSAGSKSTTINITILDLAITSITYSTENFTLSVYHTITATTPSTTGGTATSWGIHPGLPNGMSFDNTTGKISGTPEGLQTTPVTYTVWANNSGGSFSDQINITINDHAPEPVAYLGPDIILDYNQTLTPISGFETAPDLIGASEDHTCAIKDDGSVKCWGRGSYGRLGNGATTNKNTPVSTNSFGTNRTVIDITAGDQHTCAVLDDGTVSCWGRNQYGELGDGTRTSRSSPTQTIALGRPAVAVESGFDFSCALMDNGSVMCWGRNNHGQLGRGYSDTDAHLGSPTPMYTMPLPSGRYAKSIDISHYHACAVLDDGSVACWGSGTNYRLGTGTLSNKNVPTQIAFFNSSNPAADVALGRWSSCGLLENGSVTCWGTGFLGSGGSGESKSTPGKMWPNIGSGRTAVKLELGRWHNCVILDNSDLKCWGKDDNGQMGNGGGAVNNELTPKKVNLAPGVIPVGIITGHWHTCILSQTHKIYCWGDGAYGKLGDGQTSANVFATIPVNHFSGTNPVKAHGDVTSWAIHPALPTGLFLGPTNGTLYGTPTLPIPAMRTYTIYANNSGGSTSFTINIDVNDEAPDISYNPDWFVLTNNTAMSPTATPTNAGGAIPSSTIEAGGDVGQYSSITIDSSGYKHISYWDITNEDLKYATDIGGSWTNVAVDSTGNVGKYTSIAIDSNKGIHISYYDETNKDLKYATCASSCVLASSWTNSSIDTSGDLGIMSSIAIDANDKVHISYYNDSDDDLKYATNAGGSWVNLTVDSVGSVGYYNSIAIASNGSIHVSYFDFTNEDLKYATCVSSCNSFSSWSNNSIDEIGIVGRHSSIAIDSNDKVHISYYRNLAGNLKYANNVNGSWENISLDNTGDVGKRTSIAIDSSDGVHISYWDVTNYDLKYAACYSSCMNFSSWSNVTVDDIDDVGYQTAIAIDASDVVHITYYDNTNKDLKYVVLGSSSDVYAYSISPELPSGLVFNMITGEISGTPTTLSINKTYTVSARNSGGLDSVSINIEILDQIPSNITYSPENITLTNNTVSGDLPLVPSITGPGAITSWELNNTDLPTGISFGSGNGTLYGNAVQLWPMTAYKVWANNSGGSVEIYFNLTVNDQLPTLSYTITDLILTKGEQSTDLPLDPTLTGPGMITSWEMIGILPNGLNFGTNNGTIWGIASQLQTTGVVYTIWANNTGGATSATITITVNDVAPGSFEYIPENNSITKNSLTHIAPTYVNLSTGNGMTWQVSTTATNPGSNFAFNINGIVYFNADPSQRLWAYNPSNNTSWRINGTVDWVGEHMAHAIGDTMYFSAHLGGTGRELYAYNTTNSTMWLVSDIRSGGSNSNPGELMSAQSDDLLFFRAHDGSNYWLYAYNTTNDTLWKSPKNFYQLGFYDGRSYLSEAIGDTLYFSGRETSTDHHEVWAYSASNFSAWMVKDIYSGPKEWGTQAGYNLAGVVNGILLFDAWDGASGPRTVWAHNPANETTWELKSSDSTNSGKILSGSNCGLPTEQRPIFELDNVAYFCADGTTGGEELWAYNTSNETTWLVAEINPVGHSNPGIYFFDSIGDTIYFNADDGATGHELWAYDTSNLSTWRVLDINSGPNSSNPGNHMSVVIGDVLYFNSDNGTSGSELFAYDTSNQSIWMVSDLIPGATSSNLGFHMAVAAGGKLVFGARHSTSGTTSYLFAHEPTETNWMTNTGGPVTSWAINNTSLPSGLTFSTTNGTIYGTPTQLWPKTAYRIWANNSGGSISAYLNITIVDEVPTLSYTPSTLVLTINNQSSDLPMDATLTGPGAITSWEISPALPSGLTFETSNGTIWGTPTTIRSLRTYTIWANNTGGSTSATVNITVNDELPNISYSPDWFVLTNNTLMSPTATPTNTGGAIPSTTIDSNGNAGNYNAIALDSNGYRHVAYTGTSSGASGSNLMYATDASGTWVSISLDSTGNVGASPSIEIDSDDNIHITYFRTDSGNQAIKYATCSSSCSSVSSWTNSTIFPAIAVGYYKLVMSIDSNDDLHLIYYNGSYSSGNLKYATCSSSCATESSWTNITIDGTSQAGFSGFDLVIDSSDHLHVAYSLFSTNDLKYITCSSSCTSVSSWTNISVDTVGEVGRMPSIAVDSNDDLHISYYDDDGDGLKYAWCSSSCTTASSWANTSIANGSSYGTSSTLVGFYSDLAFDSDGHMHITHLDWSYRWLLYSTCSSSCSTNSSWSHSVLMSDYDVLGNGPSLVIDSNDELNIVFYDYIDDDLEFMLLDASSQPYEYSISPDLPTGLSINPTTGTISGIPRELSTNTTYTITVRNSGGTNTTTITIEVLDQLPGLSYSPENLTLTNNTASANLPLTPNLIGSGVITSWELNNTSLPAGISFGASNGTLYGTATQLWPTTSYMVYANNSGGSVFGYFNLSVNDELPTDIAYSPENVTLTNNTASSDLPLVPSITGPGVITSWALNDTSLPAGISFGASNGTFYGTPTELWIRTAYMVWANNSGGSKMAYLNITVNDQLPTDVSYSPENITLTNNTVSGDLPLAPSITGSGLITSWELNNTTLPAGISFGASNGTFYGTPTELWTRTAYMVWANNSGGSAVAYLNITVNDQLPAVSYSASVLILTNNTASTDLPHVPVITGAGLITSWEINNTNLPSGLVFGINNGTIYGIPTQLWPETQYKIWGNNSGGTTLSEVTITVNDQLPTLAYNPHNITLTNNTVSPDLPLVPAVNGSGIITSWELNDTSLPSGISFGSNNGTIYGVATQLWPNTAYKVWANNTGGSVEFYFNLTVIDQVPTLAYNPITLTLTNNTISSNLPLSPTITGSGVITSWELEDTALPNGISFGASNGTFYGVPTQLWPTKTYTIWANNSGGAIPATITITVNDQLPNNISYNPESITLVNNTVSSDLPLSPSINGPGFITSWELNNTSLPSGISFGTNNGTIYGIATQLWPTTAYKVWANNSGGSTVAYLNITVIDQLPTISYSPADIVLTNNTTSTDLPLAPTIIGPGEIVSWEFNGTLPSGINFGNNNGTFWGIPTKLLNQTQYIVWANNTGGSSFAYVNITVVDQLPTLSYIPENLTLLNNTQSPSLPIGPTLTGAGIILEWGITDGLPDGLSFGNDNGTIWGIPTERMNKTMFTIWANNTGGSVTANINITVLHQMPMFNYSVLDLVLVNNTVMTNVTSVVTGGEIVSWEVSPDMPDGINLDGEGNISGLPIIVQDRTMYMIWANNSGGSHIVYLNITIYDIIATLDYIPENLTLTRNVTISDLSPTYTGIVDSWTIYPDLPDGLNFTNGTISGTPEKNMTRSTYTVYANNTGGSISHTINITVLEPIMEFDYIPHNVTLINNTASTDMPMLPILYNDGVAETWEIWPTLPDGLNFSSSNGTISGIATKLQIAPVNYTVWANNSGGVASAIISITIIDQLPNLSYPRDLDLMNNTDSANLPMTPILDGAGVIVNWDIWPEIPEGLNFSNENGSITGIATELLTKTQFTVWANNSGGSSMATFNITIVDQVPNDIGYNHLNLVLTKNENNSDILPLTPNLVGAGNITSWDINGTLPDGLNFSNANGTIWGIPTELFFEWQYFTIYANNSGGSVNSTIAIIINDQIPTISYNISDVVFKNDTKISSIEATIGGGPFTTLAIHPDLPDGMYFDYDNATIWGLPTELTSEIEYTIWANNSGGSSAATILMTIEENEPHFEYMGNDLTFYANKEMAELPLTVISSGGEIQNFSITPQLPEGLFFGELNGTIWGIATEDSEDTAFTITAYNAIGDYSYNVNLVVYDYLYEFELDPVWIGNDTFMPAITPTYIIPGATYSISPSLPEGMSVNPYTGVVSGRPNGTKLLTSYTLTASVDGYTLNVPMELGILEDTDLDGMPDQIPPGGNALGIIEDNDDDNDNVDDMTEMDCDTNPLDADDKPKFNSNGNCAPEPQGIGFLWCLPLILLLLLLIALIISTKKKDEVDVVAAVTKPSEKKKGREKWMQDYRIDDDEVEWGEDKEGNWWRRAKREVEWTEWDRES